MSAIGEYIHLTGKGYAESGINRPHKSPGENAAAALGAEREAIMKQMVNFGKSAQVNTKTLENEFNKFLQRMGKDDSKGEDNSQELENYLFNQLAKEIAQLYNINWETGATVVPGPVSQFHLVNRQWKQRLISRVNEFNAVLKQLERAQLNKKGADASQVQDLIARADTLINDTYQKTYQRLNQAQYKTNKTSAVRNMIKEVNKLIREYNSIPEVENSDNKLLKGIAEEIPDSANAAAFAEMSKNLALKIPGIRIEVEKPAAAKRRKFIDLGEMQETLSSTDKNLKIEFTWNRKQQVNLKINNLQLKGNQYKFIDIGLDTSLYDLLDGEYDNFVNHYYNLFTQHQDKHASLASERKSYNEIVKLVAIYKAFANSSMSQDKIFIYADSRMGGKVRIISIKDLLDAVVKKTDKMQSVTFEGESITKMQLLANKKEPNNLSGSIRISKVLAEAHNRKIRAALNSTLITSL